MTQKNKQFVEVGQTRENRSVPLWILKDPVSTVYDATISTDTEIAIGGDVGAISITVLESPVFVKAKTATGGSAVSSSNFTRLLGVGQHDFFIGKDITHLSFIEETAGGKIAVSQFKY